MFKKYGPVFLIYWNGVWLLSGLSIYGALELGNVDPLPLARAIHLDSLIDLDKIGPAHGNVAVAIVLNEVAELVRFPFVLATVPKVTAWWDAHKPSYFRPAPRADGSAPPSWADLVKLHGPVFIVWWGSLWALGAGGLFLGFEYHFFGAGVDAMSLAREWGVDQVVDLSGLPPRLGNVGVAVAFNEVLEVVRFPFALMTVKYWTRWWYGVQGKELPK